MEFRLYSPTMLPRAFRYPDKLQKFAQTGDYPALYPWWFVDAATEAGDLFYETRQHDGRNLVPFTKVDDGRDDIACFDRDDETGNPEVLMRILDGLGRHYSYRDFEAWLSAALTEANGG